MSWQMANTRNSSNDAKAKHRSAQDELEILTKENKRGVAFVFPADGHRWSKIAFSSRCRRVSRHASPHQQRCNYRRRVRGARKPHSETEKKKSLASLPRCFNGLSAFRPLVKSAYFYSARHVLQPCYVYTSNSVRPLLILAPSPAVNSARVFEDLHVKRLITQFAPNYPHTFTTPS